MGGFASPGQSIVWHGGRRVVVGPAGSGAKTYADFDAYITGLATGGALAWATNTATIAAGSYTTTASVATGGALMGSSWLTFFKGTASAASAERIIQHGLVDAAAVAAQRTGGRKIFLRIIGADATAGYVALDRNGFLSAAGVGNNLTGRLCDLILIWVGADVGGAAYSMNPSAGTGPTPYTW